MVKRRISHSRFSVITAIILIVVVASIVLLGWHIVASRSSNKAKLQPPVSVEDQKKNQPPDGTQQTLEGRIVYSSCSSSTNSNAACDGFSFVDSQGKYWLIGTPSQQLNDYAASNKRVKVTAAKTGDSLLEIISIEALP